MADSRYRKALEFCFSTDERKKIIGRKYLQAVAAAYNPKVDPKDRVAVGGLNSLEYLAVFLGALRAGAAVAPLPTGAITAQLATMVADSGARHFFVDATVPAFDSPAQRIHLDASGWPSR